MTETRDLRITRPEDLLAAVPTFFGFHPEQSVVLLTAGARQDRLNGRFDLPVDQEQLDAMLADVRALAGRQPGGTVVVVAVYTDDSVLADAVVEPLLDVLEAADSRVPLAIRAHAGRWYCLADCDRCPPEGVPYDVSTHPIVVQAVVDGRVVHPSRAALNDSLLPTDPDAVEHVAEALDLAVDRLQAAARHPAGAAAPERVRAHLVQEGRWVQHRVRRFLADGEPLDAHDVGRMLVAFLDVDVRDVAWAEMTRETARAHVRLWTDVVRRSPLDALAAPAALLGFAAWLAGDGALAWCAVERCHEADPDYSMAGLLSTALAGAMPPSSWRPIPQEMLTLFAG